MHALMFYLLAFVTVACAFLVVANPWSRSPVTSALFLVATILSLAGLFVLLHAFFLAAIQVLVYAGAVMVLFLFVIMLLNLREEEQRQWRWASVISGTAVVAALAFLLLRTVDSAQPITDTASPLVEGSTRTLGILLFTRYLLPFEIISVLLLVAIVGTVLLSKRVLK
jgi:NADH-quinone oxidoreductase subunit J